LIALILDSELLCDYNIVEGNKLHLFIREDASNTTQQPPADFYEQLQKFLEKHFAPQDVEKVLEEFRKNLSDQLRHLSLDDIERIATFHLDSDKDQHSQPCAAEPTPMHN
ncbi:ubiquitin-like protein 4A, partial [Stegodyphus dumicola]|uniref:ubiquitin-like protein 4A n=1 Tax=Stegodyphus dumicola TaxID=202533 RepID=UPI0015B31E9F